MIMMIRFFSYKNVFGMIDGPFSVSMYITDDDSEISWLCEIFMIVYHVVPGAG